MAHTDVGHAHADLASLGRDATPAPPRACAQNTWVVFDVVNAVGDHTVELEIRTGILGGVRTCEMYVLALDGIYLNTAPRYRDFVVSFVVGQGNGQHARSSTVP